MPLASWMEKPRPVEFDMDSIPDSIATASGYRHIGDDFYTLVPPVGGPIHDTAVVRAIQAFDPGAIPIWRKQIYLPPNSKSSEMFTHLAFGRRVRFPHRALALFNVERPIGYRGEVPNELLIVWEFFDNRYTYEGGPGGVFPSDMRQFRFMRADYMRGDQKGPERMAERAAQVAKWREDLVKGREDEIRYRQRHLDDYVSRKLDYSAESIASLEEWKRQRREGRSPRLSVHLKGAV